MWSSTTTYIALAAISITNAFSNFEGTSPLDTATCAAIGDSNDWTLVRAITKSVWFATNDALQGTYQAIDVADEFNIGSFEGAVSGFNQYLFTTGDCTNWLITSKDAIGGPLTGSYYSNALRWICSSSEQATAYQTNWYNRGNSEDPWISTIPHHDAIGAGKLLYGESNFNWASHTTQHLQSGVYVYIRNGGTLDDQGCMTDPCATKQCNNGLYCDGEEYCDPQTGDCADGETVICPENMECDNDAATCVRDCGSFAIDEYLVECSAEWNSDQIAIAEVTSYSAENGQRLDGVDGRLDGIDGRLDDHQGRLDDVDGRLSGIDGRLDVDKGRLDGIDGRLDGVDQRIDDQIAHLHDRINGFAPYTTTKAEGESIVGGNGMDVIPSGYFDGYTDIIIMALLVMNMVTMIVSCYMYSKKKEIKYRVVAMQESEDEERALKK